MKGKTTWICVADAAGATLYRSDGPGTPFRTLERLLPEVFEDEHQKGGRVHESADTSRHAMEPRSDPEKLEKRQFADAVANRIDAAAAVEGFDRLILVAPPRFLGDLRQALGEKSRKATVLEVNKDLTRLDPAALRERLAEVGPV